MVGQSYSGNANVASNATSGSGVRPVSGAAVVPVTTMLDVNGGSFPRTTVSSFKIGKFEVTWDEWKAVRGWAVAYGGYSDLANVGDGIGRNTAVTDEDAYGSYPVTKVSWCDVVKWCNAKSRLLLDFSRGAQRVSPVCCGLLLWFRWAGCEKVDQSPHGRDGHAPLFRCKVQFQRDNGIKTWVTSRKTPP